MKWRSEKIILWLLFGVGIFLIMQIVVVTNIYYDEVFTIKILNDCGFDWLCLMKADPSIPPLQYLWLGLISKLSGENLIIIRIMCGVFFWSVVYWLGGKICQQYSKYSRLLFSLLMAFSTYQMQYAFWAYIYGMVAFWTILGWYLVSDAKLRKMPGTKWWLFIVLASGLMTHYSFCWVIGAFILWTFLKENRKYRKVSVFLVVFGISYLYFFKDILLNGSKNFYVEAGSKSLNYFWGLLVNFISGNPANTNLFTFWPLLMVILLLLFFSLKEKNKKYFIISYWPWLCLVVSIFVAAGVMTSIIKIPVNQHRTFVPASIALLMLFSWFLGKIVEKKQNLWGWITVTLFFIVYINFNLGSIRGEISWSKRDFQGKEEAKIVANSNDCNSGLIEVKYYPGWLDLTFQYYLKKYSGGKCSVKKNKEFNVVTGKKWWVLISRYYIDEYYQDDPIVGMKIEDKCPNIEFAWRSENEDLYFCTSE